MSEIHGSPGPAKGPDDRKIYKQEYKHGAELFQKALQDHEKTTNPYKKEEFRQVMVKAMQVMNEAARGLKNKGLEEQNQQIQKDFAAYQKGGKPDPLKTDLEQAKRLV